MAMTAKTGPVPALSLTASRELRRDSEQADKAGTRPPLVKDLPPRHREHLRAETKKPGAGRNRPPA